MSALVRDSANLFVQTARQGKKNGASPKSWIFRYTLNGKTREMGLGSLLRVNADEARKRAAELREMLFRGQDPLAVKPGRARHLQKKMSRKALRFRVLQRCGFMCVACGRSPVRHGVALELDHAVPRAMGGDDTEDNLQAMCEDCNNAKGAQVVRPRGRAASLLDETIR